MSDFKAKVSQAKSAFRKEYAIHNISSVKDKKGTNFPSK